MHDKRANQTTAARVLARWLAQGLALALMFVLGAVAMHVGMHGDDQKHIQLLHDQLLSRQADLAAADGEQARLRSELDIQDGTVRALQDKILELQQELGHVHGQLAFYEQLIPPGPAGAVAIRAFDLRPEGEYLRYRVLLTRNAPEQSEPFNGRLHFVAQGRLNGESAKISLEPPVVPAQGAAGSEPGTDPLVLVFEQFQRSTGVLQAPNGLQIQSVRLEILEDDIIRATQEVLLNGSETVSPDAPS